MIVVFVVDTSPSMASKLEIASMSKLDLAKMAVESLTKSLAKRIHEHNNGGYAQQQQNLHNMGLGYANQDQFLLLSTTPQYMYASADNSFSSNDTQAACGAGGRLLVGYGDYYYYMMDTCGDHNNNNQNNLNKPASNEYANQSHQAFERELKKLKAVPPSNLDSPTKGKETATASATASASASASATATATANPAAGLNAAISSGLALLSRYRFKNRSTENFGMGRLPSPAMLIPSGGATAANALQPACLIVLTDGECLKGNGSLELNQKEGQGTPLRDFYQEPFRWDQRIFCVGVGTDTKSSTQFLPPSMRALVEVTGGCHAMLRSTAALAPLTDQLVKFLAPPRPTELPLPDPLRLMNMPPPASSKSATIPSGTFVQGGPISCFQCLEAGPHGEPSPTHRAMLLYVPYANSNAGPAAPAAPATPAATPPPIVVPPPTWCIPEAFFPSKHLDTLPPRLAQPLLTFSRQYSIIGSPTFDPAMVMKALARLDQLVMLNRQQKSSALAANNNAKFLLQRDVYICEWLSPDGRTASPPSRGGARTDHFPVAVRGGGRTVSESEEPILNIGILRVPAYATPLATAGGNAANTSYSTLTLLPPEPHILIPLLVKAADAEHRMLKKHPDKPRTVHLDDAWRSEFRAYFFRIPPYYHNALKRCLRPILPSSVHTLLSTEGIEALASQCFSKQCLQKIRTGEQMQKESNERMERQERELRRRGVMDGNHASEPIAIGYGQYDPRATTSSYLAALRMLPPPWKLGVQRNRSASVTKKDDAIMSDAASNVSGLESDKAATEILGDLPSECLVPYYEARRRWVFGGSGLTTRNVWVDGVCNDGSNSQRCNANPKPGDESLLAAAGVGVSTLNKMPTVKMGDYRERLLWTRAPIVGYGSNDCSGVAATTAPNGSPVWSVDDDALPISFFDIKTGEFSDSVQTRVRSRLTVHFGNPFRDKRGDSLIPEAFLSQRPPRKGAGPDSDEAGPMTPPGSPPHDNFAVEGEGEAVFAAPVRKSPQHSSFPAPTSPSTKKRDSVENPSPPPAGKRTKKEGSPQDKAENVSPDKSPSVGGAPPKPPPSASRPPPPSSASAPPRPKAPPLPPAAEQRKPGAPPPPKSRPPAPGPPSGKPKPPHRTSLTAPPPSGPPRGKPKPPQRSSLAAPPPRGPPPSKASKPPNGKETSTKAPSVPVRPSNVSKVPLAAPATPIVKEIPLKAQPVVAVAEAPLPAPSPAQKPPAPAAMKSVPQAAAVAPVQEDLPRPDKKPDVNLPPEWMAVWSKSQKKWYFFNKKTKKSVWQWPPP